MSHVLLKEDRQEITYNMSNDKCLEVNKGGEVGKGGHVIIYNRVAREVLPTKVTLEQGAKEEISSVNI